MAIEIAAVTFGAHDDYTYVELDQGYMTQLILQLHGAEVIAAPSSILVSVMDALGEGEVIFRIDGIEVFRIEADFDGTVHLVTVPVPDLRDAGNVQIMQPGTHTLEAIQGNAIGSATFTVINPPETPPPPIDEEDVPPTQVPGSVQPTGARRWVFQDLAPGGLGSWVMPMNPVEMESPAFTRELSVKKTTASTAIGGQFHIYEDAYTPVSWTFKGYCPTEEMRHMLEAFFELNRRWYLHDHRGRAWKVTFENLEITPRLTQIWNDAYTHQGHDYSASVLVMDRNWVELT